MRKYRFLVLTDHSKHSKENSIYPLLKELYRHPDCQEVDIASRSIEENNLFFEKQKIDELYARPVNTSFHYDASGKVFRSNLRKVDYDSYDVVWLRMARPISDELLLWLDQSTSALLINKPSGIIKTSNKAYLAKFDDVCPPIKLVYSIQEIRAFAQNFDIVLKPLREYGGKGILKIHGDILDDGEQTHLTETYLKNIENYIEKEGYLAMKFLKNVTQGDKRILVVNGEIMAASLRLPPEDSWLCNVARGGTSVKSEPTEEEIKIIQRITPDLLKEGILIFGADTLTDDDGKRILSEVNTLSIGGFPQAQKQTGLPIIKQTIQKIIDFAHAKYAE